MCLLPFLRFMFHCWSPTNIALDGIRWTQPHLLTSSEAFVEIFIIIVLIEIFPLTRPSFLLHHRDTTVLHQQFPLSMLSPIYSIFHSMKIKFFFAPFMAPFICWAFHFFLCQKLYLEPNEASSKSFFRHSYIELKIFFPSRNHHRRSNSFSKDNNWLWTLSSIYHFASFLPSFPLFSHRFVQWTVCGSFITDVECRTWKPFRLVWFHKRASRWNVFMLLSRQNFLKASHQKKHETTMNSKRRDVIYDQPLNGKLFPSV